jgi:hypothetical protein
MKRLLAFVGACLIGVPVLAQEAPEQTSPQPAPLNLPVSLDRIKDGLAQQPPEPLKGLNLTPADTPTFRVNIAEQQKFEELLSKIKWDQTAPVVGGGIYAYEQQERLFPRINNPLAQPYAGFTGGQMATLAAEALIEKYVAEKMAQVVGTALREQAEREAREEVARTLQSYLDARPKE